jgi:protocatechuate 3,4-dioxygenase beta subunit
MLTDNEGRYTFYTIKPGAYPWGNHYNAWRPNHIHFSVIGRQFEHRLVTQMYFPGDPLFEFDPIFQSVPKTRSGIVDRQIPKWTGPNLNLRWPMNSIS